MTTTPKPQAAHTHTVTFRRDNKQNGGYTIYTVSVTATDGRTAVSTARRYVHTQAMVQAVYSEILPTPCNAGYPMQEVNYVTY